MMLRIRRTKYLSSKQIKNMGANLKTLFGMHANIQTITTDKTFFWISNGHNHYGWLDTWQALQLEYHKIIKEWRGV